MRAPGCTRSVAERALPRVLDDNTRPPTRDYGPPYIIHVGLIPTLTACLTCITTYQK